MGDGASAVVFPFMEGGSAKVEAVSVILLVGLEKKCRFSEAAGVLCVIVSGLLPAFLSVLRLKVPAQDTIVEVKRDLLVLLVDTPKAARLCWQRSHLFQSLRAS